MSEPGLPQGASIEQQKKRAKDLLRAVRGGDPDALARLRRHLPDRASPRLADAQFVLARENGFDSWAAMKRHLEAQRDHVPVALEAALRRAFTAGDAAAVRELFRRHPAARAHVDDPVFPFNSPALVHFAGVNDLAMVEALLDAGADPNRRSAWWAGGFHPLHVAKGPVAEALLEAGAVPDACAAANLDRIDLLRRLLAEDPSRVHERGGDGQTPLHFARSRDVAQLLLERGADIDARDVDHRATPAQWMLEGARGAGRWDVARFLVDRGAHTDIFLAAALGLANRIAALLETDPSLLDVRTGHGGYGPKPPSSHHIYYWTLGPDLSPLQVAARFEQHAALAVMHRFAEPRQRFLAACADANAADARRMLRQRPALVHELAPDDHSALAEAAWTGRTAAVALMMELGFDPAAPGMDGGSALHCAAWQGTAASVRAILRHERGRSLVHSKDPSHASTPLGWCCHGASHCGSSDADHPAVARLLLDAGARPGADCDDAPETIRAILRSHASGGP